MATPILVTGAAGRVGAVGRTVTELLLKHGKHNPSSDDGGRIAAIRQGATSA
jgi:nucleoside-diphosphate-sugar epimerase